MTKPAHGKHAIAADKDVDQLNEVRGQRYSSMTFAEKRVFVGKAVVFIVSAGFIYPTIFSD